MRSIISKTEYLLETDKFLKGRHYLTVIGDDTPAKNAVELNKVYKLAKTLKPNGANLSATNRLKILVAPGKYTFGTKKFTIDTDFIDVVSLTGEMDIEIDGLIVPASNAIITGINTGINNVILPENKENLVFNNCSFIEGLTLDSINNSLLELSELVNILMPENAMVTSDGSYVVSTNGKYLITIQQ